MQDGYWMYKKEFSINKMFFKVEGVIQRSKTVKGAEEGRQVARLNKRLFVKPMIPISN